MSTSSFRLLHGHPNDVPLNNQTRAQHEIRLGKRTGTYLSRPTIKSITGDQSTTYDSGSAYIRGKHSTAPCVCPHPRPIPPKKRNNCVISRSCSPSFSAPVHAVKCERMWSIILLALSAETPS